MAACARPAHRRVSGILTKVVPSLPVLVSLCKFSHMATNLAIDEQLLAEALRVGG
ncbi:MAG: type II toxin-antitoxin system VapB family antitoxin, partial [Gemmatimonadaceae bacterium]